MAKEMVMVEVGILSRLTKRVRELEQKNDKLEAGMKTISEAARESQARSHVYNKREEPPFHKRIHRGHGKPLQGGNTGQVLRGDETVPVGGVQIPILGSTPHKLVHDEIAGKTKHVTTEVAKKGSHKRRPGLCNSR